MPGFEMIQCDISPKMQKKMTAGVGVATKTRLNLFTASFMARFQREAAFFYIIIYKKSPAWMQGQSRENFLFAFR